MNSTDTTIIRKYNPFPGLRPFTIEESQLFFGREGQSEEVLDNLAKNKFVAVVGSSGSGKSSLMYCGVVPILHGGFITEAGSKWKIFVSRPGNDPIGNLAREIALKSKRTKDSPINENIIQAILRTSSKGIVEALKHTGNNHTENILILADQFEELFRFKKKTETENALNDSYAYVRLLLEAVKQTDVPIYIVLTMRSDFIGECAQYQELTDLINTSHYLIPQMDRENLRLAITGPVAVGKGKISEKLVNELLNDLGDNPDQLPILQHALMRTWDFWASHHTGNELMDVEHYDSIGRMEKALSNHANEAYNELTPDEKRICENMFKTLTERGNDNRGIRHPSSLEEIAAIANTEKDKVAKVIDRFKTSGRSFLTSADMVLHSDSIIDISHESLMRIWDKLKVWVEEEALAVQMYLRLSDAAALYQEGKIGLWRPPDLQLALNWRKEKQPTLTWAKRFSPAFERAMIYLETSEKEHIAQEENKIRLQKKALRRTRTFAIVLGTAAIISLGFMVYAITMQAESNKQRVIAEQQKEEAEKQKKEAEAQKEIAVQKEKEATEQRELALQKESEAKEQTKLAEQQKLIAEKNLKEAQRQKEIANQKTKEATNQKQIADKKSQEALEEKNKAEKAKENALQLRMLSIARSMAIKSVQIEDNPELKALLAFQAYQFNKQYGGEINNPDIFDGLYYALKAKNDDEYNLLKGHSDAVRTLKMHPNKKMLYSSGSDKKILAWDLQSDSLYGEKIYECTSIIREMEISQDGNWLAFANDNFEVALMNLNTKEVTIKQYHTNLITALLFIDNNTIVSSSSDSTIVVFDKNSGEISKTDLESKIRGIDITTDKSQIAFINSDGKVGIVKLPGQEKEIIYDGQKSYISLAFNNQGDILAMGENKGSVALFAMDSMKIVKEFNDHNARINDLMFSSDDKLLATVSFDGTAHIYSMENFENTPLLLSDYSSWGMSLAFSKNNQQLFTSYVDSNIKKWDIRSENLASMLIEKINRDFTQSEWQTYVGEDIEYINTTSNYQ